MRKQIRNMVCRFPIVLMAVLAALVTAGGVQAQNARPSASEVVKKAAARLTGAPGVKVAFTLTAGGKSMEGTLVESGNKFAVTTPVASTWYNGKSMWSYNPRTNETTLSTPDADELRISNPLYYLRDHGTKYTVKYLKNQPSGKYGVALIPVDKKSPLKAVTVVIDHNYNVKEIKVTTTDRQESTLTVRSIDLKSRQNASQFEYPKIKYPKVPVIDLR